MIVDSCGVLIDEHELAYDAEGSAMGGDSHSYGEFINDTTYVCTKTVYGYPPDYLDATDTITQIIKIDDFGKIEITENEIQD